MPVKKSEEQPKNSKLDTPATRQQFGALTYRKSKKAGLEILLVTSRRTKRWIIPKGWPIKGLKPSATAAQEAYEEAGARGTVGPRSIGKYTYQKFLDEKAITVPCEVRVFPLKVKRQETAWRESSERQTHWFTAEDAVAAVEDEELKMLIAKFAALEPQNRPATPDHSVKNRKKKHIRS